MGVSKYIRVIFVSLFLCILAAPVYAVDFAAHGYYRMRSESMWDLDAQKKNTGIAHDNNRFGLIAFNQMRLRVEPMLKVNDNISIHTQFDVLDNIVFGSQDTKQLEILSPVVGTVTLPAGPGSLSMVGGAAGENGSINVRRAWMDILFPIGKLRIGRQPSQWGLGIFQNDGQERQGDFGDSSDRIMFITQYEIGDGSGSLSGGLLWDIAWEAQSDPRIGGLAGAIRDNGQDTHQYAAVLLYERDDFSAGVFGGIRRRDAGSGSTTTATDALGNTCGIGSTLCSAGLDGKTLVYFGDVYGRYTYEEYDFKAEYVFIGGKMSTGAAINAIPFSVYAGGAAGDGIINLPAKQDVQVSMGALEASGAYKWGGEWNFKGGFAQGDASPLSQRITQYGFRPDYNIALLMFNVPLGTSPQLWGCSATDGAGCASTSQLAGGVPITGNFINNAYYVSTGYQHHLDIGDYIKKCNDFSVGGRVTTAYAHKNPLDLNFQAIMSDASLPVLRNGGKWYGVEADLLIEAEFYDHLYGALEGGVLMPGSAYDTKTTTLVNPGGIIETIPADKANWSYGGRLTMMVEF
ncbi:MAG: hypothetical protein HYU98_04740 [Deltaproteobacteria bacterium]|nr:hypothetical protein [Deltaproteobacteria bacterium]